MKDETPVLLKKIGQLIETISAFTTTAEIYTCLAEFVPQLVPADHVTISQYHENHNEIVVHTFFGNSLLEFKKEQKQTLPSFSTYQEYAEDVSLPTIYCPGDWSERDVDVMLHNAGIISVLIVPFYSGSRVLGTINIGSKTHQYKEHDQARMEHLSTVLANSITHTESFRSNEAMARYRLYAKHLENMNKLSESLLQCESIDRALQLVTEYTTSLVNGKRMSLCELDSGAEYVTIIGLSGKTTDTHGTRLPLADSGLEQSLVHDQFVYSTDLISSSVKARRSLGESGYKHIWSFPIVSQDQSRRCINICSEGTEIHIQDTTSALKTMVRLFNSTVERISAQQETIIQATSDSLTGLCNRIEFNRHLKNTIDSDNSEHVTYLLYLDLDLFKNVNDTLGHFVGDQVLVEVASRLRELLLPQDTLARIGGDEFMLLLTQRSNLEDVKHTTQQIVDSISNSDGFTEKNIAIGASVGVCQYPDHGQSAEELVKNADIAMYRAKELGRNQYFIFNEQLSETVSQRIQLQKDLQTALDENQFSLVFQPQFDIETLLPDGAEVLIRWEHPTLGWIRPDIFIPIAEDCGLISAITDWVLKNALKELKHIQHDHDNFRLAVNISAIEFSPQNNLQERLDRALHESDIPHSSLEIELTETAFLQHPEHASKLAKDLSDAGIRIAIDDFGTGYGSLTYLVQLPISCIKVDRSFVNGIENDDKKQAIVKGIVAISQGLNISCLAEGIETTQQLEWLDEVGCHTIQGYLLSKPVSVEELREIIQARYTQQTKAA